jgi:hypothetical protein
LSERITDACNTNGFYTLSAGTLDPSVVLTRLLDALALLDPQSHEVITAAAGQYACIPRAALEDALSDWWNTDDAQALLERIIAAINAAAPPGYVCVYRAGDCLELARIDTAPPGAGAPSAAPSSAEPPSVVLAPKVSAVRARVRVPR